MLWTKTKFEKHHQQIQEVIDADSGEEHTTERRFVQNWS